MDDDWFRIIESDEDESFVILKGLLKDFKKMTKRYSKPKPGPKEKETKQKKAVAMGKKKVLEIVTLDLVLQYRYELYYINKASELGPIKDKKEREMLFNAAACTGKYAYFLQGLMVKLGETTGHLDLPYHIESKSPDDVTKSHVYIEKKILAMYRKILHDFTLDHWLKNVVKYTIDMKAKHTDKMGKICRI